MTITEKPPGMNSELKSAKDNVSEDLGLPVLSTNGNDLSGQSEAPSHPPKDDARAWLTVLGAWLLFVAAWGPVTAYGAFELYYTSTLLPQYPSSTTAWIGSVGSFLLTCSGVVVGPLFDRGHLKPILVIGCVLMVLGMMMLSLATEYYQVMLSQGVCFGLSAGLVCVPALAFVTGSFDTHRAYAVGVTTTGASFGGVIFPIMFIKLVPRVGFPWTCRIFGFLILGLSIVRVILVWSAPAKKTKPRRLFEIGAFKEPTYLTLAVAMFLQFLGYWIPIFFIPTYAGSVLGISDSLSIYAVAIFNAGSIFGRLLPTVLIVRFGAVNVVFAATLAASVILFCWIAVGSLAGYVVWCMAIGVVSGVFISGAPVIVSHPEISSLAVLGSRLGQLWFCAGIGTVIGAPIAGTLADPATGEFLKVQIFAGCILAGAACAFLYPLWRLNSYDHRTKTGQQAAAHRKSG